MNRSLRGKFAFSLACSLILILLASGCRQEQPVPEPTPRTAGTFTGQELPDQVESLEGTPLYSSSEELDGIVSLEGAAYLLIAPQDPTKALLVLEEGATPEEVKARESKPIVLSGEKESLEAQALAAHVKERYQLDLQSDEAGRVVALRVKAGAAPEATPRNGASAQGE